MRNLLSRQLLVFRAGPLVSACTHSTVVECVSECSALPSRQFGHNHHSGGAGDAAWSVPLCTHGCSTGPAGKDGRRIGALLVGFHSAQHAWRMSKVMTHMEVFLTSAIQECTCMVSRMGYRSVRQWGKGGETCNRMGTLRYLQDMEKAGKGPIWRLKQTSPILPHSHSYRGKNRT